MFSDILGIGHCCQDNICIVENFPQEDGSTHIMQIDDNQGGGAVATALVAAARLGASTGIIANLGIDIIGDKILEGLRLEGVQINLVNRIQFGRSSSSIIMVNPKNGSRTKFPYRDNLPDIQFTDEIREAFVKAKVLHLDGTQYRNAIRAAKLAKEIGLTVSLDACSMEEDNEKNKELVSLADILITNAKYPFRLTGKSSVEEALMEIAKMGPSVVVTTVGKDGCYYVKSGMVKHLSAYPVDALDTTGAGDTFHGAFLAQWLKEKDIEGCLRFASAASALKCLKYGGRAGIPARKAIEEFLCNRYH